MLYLTCLRAIAIYSLRTVTKILYFEIIVLIFVAVLNSYRIQNGGNIQKKICKKK
jgi:hypothetical protein